jgi:hypothetical protein
MTGTTTTARAQDADARFFRTLITVMAVVLVSGFVVQLAAGRSSFQSPPIVHLHAVAFMGWVAIVLTQFWLAGSGAIAHHRQLGRLAVVYGLALLVIGPLVTIAAVQAGRVPFFFQPQHLLIADPFTLIPFAGLFAAAIVLRKRTDWHARLQVGAFLPLMGPGIGRILPMPLLTPYAFEVAALVALVFPVIGMARDIKVHGRPHPAWFWGIGALIAALALARVVALSPLGDSLYDLVTANSPMAGADGRAFPMPPGPPPPAQ